MHTEPAKRGRPRDPDAEPRIRACAVELLLERGFDRMTVDDVAEAAGVGKATIYRRWASKEQLAYDALTHLFDIEVPEPDTGSFENDIRELYQHAVALVGTEDGRAMIRLSVSESTRDAGAAKIYREFIQRRIDQGGERLKRARDRGEPIRDDVDPAMVAEWIAGLLVLRVVTGAPMPTELDVDEMVRLTLRGVMRPDAS
jgi:AcrR family transcriptional regulator